MDAVIIHNDNIEDLKEFRKDLGDNFFIYDPHKEGITRVYIANKFDMEFVHKIARRHRREIKNEQ